MQVQTGIQLPVSHTQVDTSYFNQSLPQGNDVFPPLTFLPGAPTDTIGYAISVFRTYAQSRATKSPIHCFVYNLLQQNKFSNQLFQAWAQSVADFTDFLQRGQNQPPAVAADKAASRIYQILLASVASQYPAIQQYLPTDIINGLNDAQKLTQSIHNDVNQFKTRIASGGQNAGMMGMGGGMPNQPNYTTHVTAYSVPGAAQPAPNPGNYQNPTVPNSAGISGMMLGEPAAPLNKPLESWSGQPNQAMQPPVSPQGMAQASPPVTPQHPTEETGIIEHDMQAPADVQDIKVIPTYYVPRGFAINPMRPYDVIRNPGGVEIRPAYQVQKDGLKGWARTPGTGLPYSKLINPNTHICFLAKWVDGVVKEVVVPFEPEMDYLKHEINETLRSKAMRPKGIVVPLPSYTDGEGAPQSLEDTLAQLASGELEKAHLHPIRVDGYFTGSTDLENESLVRAKLMDELDLKEGDSLPPHEYISARIHGLDVSDECFQRLDGFKAFTTPAQVVAELKALVETGLLPLRYYNFLIQRLTCGVNDFLKDSLSISGVAIDDFMEDAIDLAEYLRRKRGEHFEKVYLGNIQSIVTRCMSVVEETGQDNELVSYRGVIDEYMNFQLGLPSEELSNLNLSIEACIVTTDSHPILLKAIRAMTRRVESTGEIKRMRLRLITSDGFYYNVIVGKLIQGAMLLKKA